MGPELRQRDRLAEEVSVFGVSCHHPSCAWNCLNVTGFSQIFNGAALDTMVAGGRADLWRAVRSSELGASMGLALLPSRLVPLRFLATEPRPLRSQCSPSTPFVRNRDDVRGPILRQDPTLPVGKHGARKSGVLNRSVSTNRFACFCSTRFAI